MNDENVIVEEPKEKKPRGPKMFEMRLDKNYRPSADFRIVEYTTDDEGVEHRSEREPEGKPERRGDNGVITRPATDEMNKVRAGTHIMVTLDEGKYIAQHKIGHRANDFA